MENQFFEKPILNSPYEYPARHWELDKQGSDPYKSLKTTLKAEINPDAWESLNSDISRPFDKPASGRIAVKVINHLGDEVMKVFRVT